MRISRHQYGIDFANPDSHIERYYTRFRESRLGALHASIPWHELVESFGLKETLKGPTGQFSPQGKLALMFLKHYSSVTSDRQLIEQLNGNLDYQFFCDISLGTDRIENFKIVSAIRCELSKQLDMDKAQQILYDHWKSSMHNTNEVVMDATCYESAVRYPTDVKLLWESVQWSYEQMVQICAILEIPRLRTKYLKWLKRYVSYSKLRRRPKKRTTAMKRGLLRLLLKLHEWLKEHLSSLSNYPAKWYRRHAIIEKVYSQQYALFTEGILPKNRIISLFKPYLRPIVRGKEVKKVEFGAKAHNYQVDGISFIHTLNFEAYNEGVEFTSVIAKAQRMVKRKIKIAGADGIYATNNNRKYVTEKGIKTDFKPKGRKAKNHHQRKQMIKAITKQRASAMEGSFGTQKQHYQLGKIRARTEATERLWIFFGIHTANAVNIAKRRQETQIEIAA